MSRSSFSSDSWSDDDSNYATFQKPRPFTSLPVYAACEEKKSIPDCVPSDYKTAEDECVYENLERRCSASALYGQIFRSALKSLKGKKQKRQLEQDIAKLFQLTITERSSEQLALIVESELDRMMEDDVCKFRQTADKMSFLLQTGSQKKLPKFNTIRKKIRSIFIK